MDATPQGLVTKWLPNLPYFLLLAILATLRKSPNTEYQDAVTEVVVASAKPILHAPAALQKSQEFFMSDPGARGRMWLAKYTVPPPLSLAPSDSQRQPSTKQDQNGALTVEEAIKFAIDVLATHEEEKSCSVPPFDTYGVEAEWTGHRPDAHFWSGLPKSSDQQRYNAMLKDLPDHETSPVILYAHGGAFCLMDPANHRFTSANLASLCNARLLSVRYRLAPQNIFPTALADMFLTYLALIAPPPGAYHTAVPASKIALAGDSSGGNLATALQILLLTLVQHGKTHIRNPWYASAGNNTESHTELTIIIPNQPTATLSLLSPWLDITRSLPSASLNGRWDIIAPPSPLSPDLLSTSPLFPQDDIWPSSPIRTETYCEAIMCAHPLVSPLTCPKNILKDFPPIYTCVGWEGMTDESTVLCRRIYEAQTEKNKHQISLSSDDSDSSIPAIDSGYHSDDSQNLAGSHLHTSDDPKPTSNGVYLEFDGYTAQPHTFTLIPFVRAGTKAKFRRAEHIRNAVLRALGRPNALQRSKCAVWTNSKSMVETQIPFDELGGMPETAVGCFGYTRTEPLTDEYVTGKIEEGRVFRVDLERRLREQEVVRLRRPNAVDLQRSSSSWSPVLGDLLLLILFWPFFLVKWVVRQLLQLGRIVPAARAKDIDVDVNVSVKVNTQTH